jgi:hypothetical protein
MREVLSFYAEQECIFLLQIGTFLLETVIVRYIAVLFEFLHQKDSTIASCWILHNHNGHLSLQSTEIAGC